MLEESPVPEATPSSKPWLQIIGAVTIVAALWATRDVAFPIALAALLTFLLSAPVSWLERRIGRVAAVLGTVSIGFAAMVMASMVVVWQLDGLVRELPRYRQTLLSKLAELRSVGRNSTVDELQKTFEQVKEELGGAPKRQEGGGRRPPTVVLAERLESGQGAFPWLGSIVGIAAQIGVVVTLVIFMLLERRDLRNRLIGVIGRGHVALTTKALDEAGSRVSRYLLMQSIVNVLYGAIAALGLWFLGVPYALLWAALGAVLRFIPYLGPIVATAAPILISAAASEGWALPLKVSALYAVLELFTNLVLETVLYAGAAGVSQVGLLLSVTFWTWLWGPFGLLVATPLTVVMVVMGKHVRGFEAIATLMADSTTLPPAQAIYQRLLARDIAEAADLIEEHVRQHPPRSVYDALLLPTLAFVESDRLDGRLTAEESARVIAGLHELVTEAGEQVREAEQDARKDAPPGPDGPIEPRLTLLAWAANNGTDELALAMLTKVLDDLPVAISMRSKLMASEMVDVAHREGIAAVCLADLPPRSPSRTRYVTRKLREQAPQLRIIVGRWGPAEYADASVEPLIRAGASHVSPSLSDTRAVIESMLGAAAPPPVRSDSSADENQPAVASSR